MSDLLSARLALGAAAILSVADAVRLLPVRDGDARAWLAERGLIRDLRGASVVVWGDVVAALQSEERSAPPDSEVGLRRSRNSRRSA